VVTVFDASGNYAQQVVQVTVSAGERVPVNTLAPEISGVAREGQTLTDVQGSWTGSPTSYTYRWKVVE
jgi:hypothetical protein